VAGNMYWAKRAGVTAATDAAAVFGWRAAFRACYNRALRIGAQGRQWQNFISGIRR
jgi:hypothetical protein